MKEVESRLAVHPTSTMNGRLQNVTAWSTKFESCHFNESEIVHFWISCAGHETKQRKAEEIKEKRDYCCGSFPSQSLPLTFLATPTNVEDTFVANRSVQIVSWSDSSIGDRLASMSVFELPPREFLRSHVSVELR